MKKYIFSIFILGFLIGCSSEPQTFNELKEAGKKAYARENYVKARDLLLKAMEQNLSDRDVLFYLGLSYKKDYILDSAIYYLKKADLLHTNDRDINMAIYQVSLEIQEWEYALDAIDVLVETGDPIEQFYELIIDLNLKIDRDYVAFLYARILLNTDLENISYYMLSANTASRIDSAEYALETIERAISKFGEKEEFILNKAIYLAQLQDYEKSEQIMRELLKTSENVSFIKLNLANVLTSMDSRDKKLEGYNLYKEIQPELGDVYPIDSTLDVFKAELNISE